jgi:hypothetical protein
MHNLLTLKTKNWNQKLHSSRPPEVKQVIQPFADVKAGSMMYISSPLIIDAYIKKIPWGNTVDIKTIRQDLATENQTEYTCPVTTGIFLRIVAEAAWEAHVLGKPISTITPFWRAIAPNSPTAKKLSFGTEVLKQMRHAEGIEEK